MHETNAPNAISNNNISSILINNGGFSWLGTINRGLIHMSFNSSGTACYKNYYLSTAAKSQPRLAENFILDYRN
jgi:hypothetical protein